jgi:superfamily I DNA/RNA helicase
VAAVSAGSSVIVPTAEQERIYQHVKPPTPLDTNFTVRITAGAGAGKTTTVLQVASNAARLGHSHITYVTFAKAAAADGARRIQEALSGLPNPPTVEARTLHSCAMKLLSNERKEVFEEESSRLINDDALQDFIKTVCEREIQDFLAHAKEEIASRNKKDLSKAASMLHAAERQVLFYVFKTFTQFCRSPYTVEQFKDPFFKCRDYFPAQKYHQGGGEGEKQGFPPTIYSSKFRRYADMACLVWDAATQQGIRSYDMEMKRAQLKSLRIPGSALLVDESQDMDGCQVNWITSQRNHGTHIYIVGDAAQTIYSFRGAKSKYMVDIQGAVDFSLTKSWRFGPEIASVANVILYAKQKSKQSSRERSSWR